MMSDKEDLLKQLRLIPKDKFASIVDCQRAQDAADFIEQQAEQIHQLQKQLEQYKGLTFTELQMKTLTATTRNIRRQIQGVEYVGAETVLEAIDGAVDILRGESAQNLTKETQDG